MPKLYIDADACPVKEEAYRVAERFGIEIFLVSNSGTYTAGRPLAHSVLVGDGFDAADDWIAEQATASDIVVTNDIPLAARCLEKDAQVLSPSGKPFTRSSIGAALALRAFNAHLRETGESNSYNAAFSKQDRSQFLQSLDQAMRKVSG